MDSIVALVSGIGIGMVGTLIGAGGGFIIVPMLMFVFPKFSSHQITAISTLCVACNATSGAIAYFYRRQIHLGSAFLYTLASLPGAWFGSSLTRFVAREKFDLLFGILLLILGVYIIIRNRRTAAANAQEGPWQSSQRNYVLGFVISIAVGFMASFIGIGGGIVHVPLLSQILLMPVHLATGTSQFILAITAIFSSIEHITHHDIPWEFSFIPYLAAGTVLGAQIGAWLSKRVASSVILQSLGMALIIVSCRLLYIHLTAGHIEN